MREVFDLIDESNVNFYGYYPGKLISNIYVWRRYFSFCVVASAFAWVVLGFDSTWSMTIPFVKHGLDLLVGRITWGEVWGMAQFYYGMGNHWSAPVIYGSLWILLSRYYEDVGIKGSLNFCLSTCFGLMSIGLFEVPWNYFYSRFQGQTWAFQFMWEQAANLFSFGVFIFLGVLCLLYVTGEYRLRLDGRAFVLFVLSLVLWFTWVNYPLSVGNLDVELDTGETWSNSARFPQTYYAVDLDPTDRLAVGHPHYVQNDLLHLLNTVTKIVSTCAIGYPLLLLPRDRFAS